MSRRYSRNIGTISKEEQAILSQKSVCIIGCGGLGGGVIENLTRIGVGKLTVVDNDMFDMTNLNRQVLSNEGNIGNSKAFEAAEQMKNINSDVIITPIQTEATEENCRQIIADHDLVIDAVDNIKTRIILEKACEEEGITLIHGAIAGWNGQVAVIRPGDKLLQNIYQGNEDRGDELQTGNPSFTPAVVSGLQAAEVIKVLLGREGVLEKKMLMIDLLEHEYEVIAL